MQLTSLESSQSPVSKITFAASYHFFIKYCQFRHFFSNASTWRDVPYIFRNSQYYLPKNYMCTLLAGVQSTVTVIILTTLAHKSHLSGIPGYQLGFFHRTNQFISEIILFLMNIDIFCTIRRNRFKILLKQESPPAWTQEAYRPPRSKCLLCWCGGGRVPHPVMGGYPNPVMVGVGTPSSHGGGYPLPTIKTWLGYPPPCRGVDWQTNWKQYLPPSFGCGR